MFERETGFEPARYLGWKPSGLPNGPHPHIYLCHKRTIIGTVLSNVGRDRVELSLRIYKIPILTVVLTSHVVSPTRYRAISSELPYHLISCHPRTHITILPRQLDSCL